jgi:hypothetical protein
MYPGTCIPMQSRRLDRLALGAVHAQLFESNVGRRRGLPLRFHLAIWARTRGLPRSPSVGERFRPVALICDWLFSPPLERRPATRRSSDRAFKISAEKNRETIFV